MGATRDCLPSFRPTTLAEPSSAPAADLPVEVEDYLNSLVAEANRAETTRATYRTAIAKFVEWLDVPLTAVTSEHLVGYLGVLRNERRVAPATGAHAYAAIAGLLRFLASHGHLAHNPAEQVEAPKVPSTLPKALAIDQVEALLASPGTGSPVALRDTAILEVLYGTGVRVSELVGLDLSSLDLAQRTARVLGKGSKERVVLMGKPAQQALGNWLSGAGRGAMIDEAARRWGAKGDARAVFTNQRGGRLSRRGVGMVVASHGKRVGLDPGVLTPHVLRHSYATHLLMGGADVRTIGELLGHASIATTERYMKVAAESLLETYIVSHPRARKRAGSEAGQT